MTIQDVVQHQKSAFRNGITRSYESRKSSLLNLKALINDNEKRICDAIHADFGKPYFESYTSEIAVVIHEIDFHLKHLAGWMKPESVGNSIFTFPSKSTLYRHPLGTALIIGAWNYPFQLTILPLVGALSAGNTAVLKPSEISSHTSRVIEELVEQYFPKNLLAVIEGGVDETRELLSQPFNKIFFTGSSRVGKIVMRAAAEQLIPVTLELGGKSPAIVHKDAKIETGAKRIWWGKTMNAGQTCVAPDFALVHRSVKDRFIDESRQVLAKFFGDDYQPGKNYARIINNDHFDRLQELIDQSDLIFGGITNRETRFIEPALVEAGWESPVMQEEIFGPLLPVVTYESIDEIIEKLNRRNSPLALYLFTEDPEVESAVINRVPFGGGCINETITHLVNQNLPFGGVGSSGMGSYHGRHSFETFSRKQSVLKKSTWPDPEFRYPPHDTEKLKWIKKYFNR